MQNLGMTPQYGNRVGQPSMEDPTLKVDEFLKVTSETLDLPYRNEAPDYYKSTILPQLLPQSRIIINGQPFGSKAQFQELWSTLPSTQHQVISFDTHLLPTPGERQYIILARLKVRFDESGRNRFGQNADLQPSSMPNSRPIRPFYSNWFGVALTMVVTEKINTNFNTECISSFDYRITEKPAHSTFAI
ncbi:DEKNAAC105564 [Brettanomyces naardenensis]|uniref:DEKNAAC105564 n=1 Tax=Brettanomyces naardenensis TaxID=13370 RepID=A0A448YTV6_BRENA|nr:DEKNAAC105564 [Brettanomyces naardenensis]